MSRGLTPTKGDRLAGGVPGAEYAGKVCDKHEHLLSLGYMFMLQHLCITRETFSQSSSDLTRTAEGALAVELHE